MNEPCVGASRQMSVLTLHSLRYPSLPVCCCVCQVSCPSPQLPESLLLLPPISLWEGWDYIHYATASGVCSHPWGLNAGPQARTAMHSPTVPPPQRDLRRFRSKNISSKKSFWRCRALRVPASGMGLRARTRRTKLSEDREAEKRGA